MDLDKNFYKNADKLLEDLFNGLKVSDKEAFDIIKKSDSLNKNENNIELIFNELKIVTMTINANLPMIIKFQEFRDIICSLIGKKNKITFISIQFKTEEGENIIIGDKRKKVKLFYNCFTLKIESESKNILNLKYFKNGSIQITGCKDLKDVEDSICYLIEIIKANKSLLEYDSKLIKEQKLKYMDTFKVKELKCIAEEYKLKDYTKIKKQFLIKKIYEETEYKKSIKIDKKYNKKNIDKFNVKDSDIKISMINSSYEITFKQNKKIKPFLIDRKNLYTKLNTTDLVCYYDNTQHQGVKINYMYNEENKTNGVCRCKDNCLAQVKTNRICKKITILLFNSGKIIITGANNFNQSKEAYNFINDFIRTHTKDILQFSIF